MAQTFPTSPPLVEIIAEVRWGAGIVGSQPSFQEPNDATYVAFGIAVGKAGYSQLERIIPSGFPVPLGSVVYRYRKVEEDQHTLYQLGPGIFTANGLPPYDSWSKFRPHVMQGLSAAIEVENLRAQTEFQLILRYVDAFVGENLAGETPYGLMHRMVGFSFNPPKNVDASRDPHSARFSVEYPCLGSGVFTVEAGRGMKEEHDALILNTTVGIKFNSTDPSAIISKFDELQDVLHDAYLEFVSRISMG